MSSLTIAFVVGVLIAVSGMAGLTLQRLLPEGHTAERSRDMIGGVVGLLTLLLALVLGLLIWTAYGVFSTQQTELQTIAARALEFDLEMRQYGPEGDRAREILRRDLVWAHEQFWGDETSRSQAYDASVKAMSDMSSYFDGLKPATPAQTHLLDEARHNYSFIGENRILMAMQTQTPVSWPLIYAVAAWSCLMFFGMGLLSRPNPTTATMLVLGAASVALAIFLILEFNKPYTSTIRVSPVALEEAIVQLDQPGAPAK
ncbi:MAG TPA: hypothetical protein VKR62_05305 [Roseiarcus sp.]|nr:hypothetical protein [Roseiarcus sp.]